MIPVHIDYILVPLSVKNGYFAHFPTSPKWKRGELFFSAVLAVRFELFGIDMSILETHSIPSATLQSYLPHVGTKYSQVKRFASFGKRAASQKIKGENES